jgi:translation initiation factor IF-3
LSKKNITPINEKIRAEEVMLIGANGEKMGVLPFSEALKSASAASLDLVQVSPSDANPIVCKLLDYGKHLFDKKKQKSASKKKQKRTQLKEIKFRPGTEENDYQIKLKSIMRFIQDGDKAKITMRFRGREMAHQNLGFELLKRIETDLFDQAVVEQEPQSEGRQLVMVMSPTKKKN